MNKCKMAAILCKSIFESFQIVCIIRILFEYLGKKNIVCSFVSCCWFFGGMNNVNIL